MGIDINYHVTRYVILVGGVPWYFTHRCPSRRIKQHSSLLMSNGPFKTIHTIYEAFRKEPLEAHDATFNVVRILTINTKVRVPLMESNVGMVLFNSVPTVFYVCE